MGQYFESAFGAGHSTFHPWCDTGCRGWVWLLGAGRSPRSPHRGARSRRRGNADTSWPPAPGTRTKLNCILDRVRRRTSCLHRDLDAKGPLKYFAFLPQLELWPGTCHTAEGLNYPGVPSLSHRSWLGEKCICKSKVDWELWPM